MTHFRFFFRFAINRLGKGVDPLPPSPVVIVQRKYNDLRATISPQKDDHFSNIKDPCQQSYHGLNKSMVRLRILVRDVQHLEE